MSSAKRTRAAGALGQHTMQRRNHTKAVVGEKNVCHLEHTDMLRLITDKLSLLSISLISRTCHRLFNATSAWGFNVQLGGFIAEFEGLNREQRVRRIGGLRAKVEKALKLKGSEELPPTHPIMRARNFFNDWFWAAVDNNILRDYNDGVAVMRLLSDPTGWMNKQARRVPWQFIKPRVEHLGWREIHHRVGANDGGALIRLLNRSTQDIDRAADGFMITPLKMAIGNNNQMLVQTLLTFGANRTLSTGPKDPTPFQYAVEFSTRDIVSLLYDHALCEKRSYSGYPPLHVAIIKKKLDVAEVLLKNGVKVDSFNSARNLAIYLACQVDDPEMVRLLVKFNAKCGGVHGRQDQSPLHACARFGSVECTKCLLGYKSIVADGNGRDSTPLHTAARYGKTKVIGLLVKAGANVNVRCPDGSTPLHTAAAHGYLRACEELIRCGADMTVVNARGKTVPGMASAKAMRDSLVKMIMKYQVIRGVLRGWIMMKRAKKELERRREIREETIKYGEMSKQVLDSTAKDMDQTSDVETDYETDDGMNWDFLNDETAGAFWGMDGF